MDRGIRIPTFRLSHRLYIAAHLTWRTIISFVLSMYSCMQYIAVYTTSAFWYTHVWCMIHHLLLCFIICAACPPRTLRVISYESTNLLPVQNLSASSEDTWINPVALMFGRGNVPFSLWCSESGTGLKHHVNVTFSQPVVISALISSGFSDGYVNNFTVEFSADVNPDFQFHKQSEMGKVTNGYNCIPVWNCC